MFSNIYHIGYLTEDNAAAIEFYVTMFRAELIGEGTSADGKSKMAFLKVGKSEVEFIEVPERVKAAGKGTILLDFDSTADPTHGDQPGRLDHSPVGWDPGQLDGTRSPVTHRDDRLPPVTTEVPSVRHAGTNAEAITGEVHG